MTPTLILIVLAAAVIAGLVWYIRRKPARPYQERSEQDTAWNDPVDPERRP